MFTFEFSSLAVDKLRRGSETNTFCKHYFSRRETPTLVDNRYWGDNIEMCFYKRRCIIFSLGEIVNYVVRFFETKISHSIIWNCLKLKFYDLNSFSLFIRLLHCVSRASRNLQKERSSHRELRERAAYHGGEHGDLPRVHPAKDRFLRHLHGRQTIVASPQDVFRLFIWCTVLSTHFLLHGTTKITN